MRWRRFLLIVSGLIGAVFIGPLAWALADAVVMASSSDVNIADRSALELHDIFNYVEHARSDRMMFDPHVFDVTVVAKDCGVPWDKLKIDLDTPSDRGPWTPARGWEDLTTQSIATDVDEERSLDAAALKKRTSLFERAFLIDCITSSAARSACMARVRGMTGVNRREDDPQEKSFYDQARADQHRQACLFLRGLAAERSVSTP